MSPSTQHSGESRSAPTSFVVIVGRENETASEVESAISSRCPDTTVHTVSDVDAAESILADRRVDCLVVIGDVGTAAFLDRVGTRVLLYTSTDPADVDAAVLDAIDTLVQRSSATERHEFLAEKVQALLVPTRERDRTRYAVAKALARLEECDADDEAEYFLVDEDGTAVWSSAPFEAVFPVDRLDADLPETTTFDERLARLLAGTPSAIETVTRTRRDESSAQCEAFTIPTPTTDVHYLHTGYRLPAAAGSLRLEVFERVTTEVHRAARTEILERLVESSKDGLYTLDENGNIDFCNEAFADMVGTDKESLLGEHASTVLADGELERGQQSVERLLADPDRDSVTVDLTFVTTAGEQIEVSIHYTLLLDEDDSYAGLMGVARDITERKQRERTLEQYRRLVEVARDPMYVLDSEGTVDLCNDAMEEIAAVPRSQVVGSHITDLLPPHSTEAVQAAIDTLREGSSHWKQFEVWVTNDDGTDRLYEATTGALTEDGTFTGSVGILHDITERDRRADELDLLQQVLGRVLRHNIRSELTVIQCHAARLRDGVGDVETATERILSSADELLETAEKAHKIGRLVESDIGRTAIELDTVVREAVGAVADEHPQATYDIDVPSVTVQAHPSFRLAVENAVENAVVHDDSEPTVAVSATATADRVVLAIADTGPGMPVNELEALERHEETPLSHSTGAGLWLIDWVVARSDGSLSFESDESGTTVRIELDRSDAGTPT